MKQITNISMLVMVLSIPFALSQTRKAIPAGRYEALSGIKTSHSVKSNDALKDSVSLFWSEVAKHIPQGRNENSFYTSGEMEPTFKTFLSGKGVHELKSFDNRVNILLSSDLNRDIDLYKKMSAKGNLIILKDKHSLKEIMSSLNQFDVVVYSSEPEDNYFLLKRK